MKWWIVIPILLLVGCREVPVVDMTEDKGDTLKEQLINANRIINNSEESAIDAYIERRGWDMQRLTGGARLMVTLATKQARIEYDDTLQIRYNLEAINGAVLYNNVIDTLVVGRWKEMRGLDAALPNLRYGTKAVVILPSEQAYGVVGDGDRIGQRLVIVVKIEDIVPLGNHSSKKK